MSSDLRLAVRSVFRNPWFTIGAILTLALGIGVNSTIFTLANGMLFRPMAGVAAPSELVWVSGVWRDRGRATGLSYTEYVDYTLRATEPFSSLFAFSPVALSLGSGGEPLRIRGHLVSGSYFSTLGVTPALGRLLQPADDEPATTPAVVIGFRLWQQRFGGAADVLQQPITINGQRLMVAGVAPEGFIGPERSQSADIWVPIAALPSINAAQAAWLNQRDVLWVRVIGRLRNGATPTRAQSIVAGIAAGLEEAYPEANKGRTATISSAASGVRAEDRGELLPVAVLLLTVTGLVLFIACANVANLLLARGAGRSLEFGIRVAMGATRGRLVRQLLTESLVLAAAAAVLGLLISFWAADIVTARLPAADFAGLAVTPDLRLLIFTAGLAFVSVCVFGLIPALTASRAALASRLRTTPSSGGRTRLQGAFVVAQLSLSLVLLLAAGLSLRALQKSSAIDLGFNAKQVFTASYDLVLQNYPEPRRHAFRQELRTRIAGLPGVTSVALANLPPLSGTMFGTVVSSTGSDGSPVEARAYMNSVGPDYFTTLELPILKGRGITDEDRPGAPSAVVINETLARQLWGTADPLRRVVRFDTTPLQVVGIARDSKYDEATEDPRPFLYVSLAQQSLLDRETVIVRTAAAPDLMAPSVHAAIRALDPTLPIFDARSFDTLLKDRVDKQRGISGLFAVFGLLALLLAVLGVYGVMAYSVTRRNREMGVRLALGASPAQLTRLMTRDGLRLALMGVGIGAMLAIPLARVMGALIFGVQVADVAAFVGTCLLLVVVVLLAALVPARRAARLDPMIALRSE
jgi:predicted permease